MVRQGAALKYEVRSLTFMRIYEDTDFPWDFLAIFYKMEASINIKYFKLENSYLYIISSVSQSVCTKCDRPFSSTPILLRANQHRGAVRCYSGKNSNVSCGGK